MKHVNIYVESIPKSIGKNDGYYIYLLEYVTDKGPATYHRIVEYKDKTPEQAQLQAVTEAITHIHKPCEVTLFVTVTQLVTHIRYFLKEWAKRDYRNQNGDKLKDYESWKNFWLESSVYQLWVNNGTHEYSKWLLKQLEQCAGH